ncbi:NAD(P)/FAD-dependent oxidoreductase [Nocardioides sp. NPDC058538]|uniref:NAD(P)/FAD-dependent oxidoreductase n=1 Tax=Nocardioides sp. NPDC058538 TaxID=3346542 RepID=UPI003669A36C
MTRTQLPIRRSVSVGTARSYWMRDALSLETAQADPGTTLTASLRADVCIVGGGFTGMWTAIELKQREPSLDIVLIEADLCGSGASGTNAGMLMNLWPKMPALLKAGGPTEGLDVARASVEAIDYIRRFCVENRIDVQWEPNGWLWASNNPSQDGVWDETLAASVDQAGSPFEEIDSVTATALAGTAVRGGILDSTCVGLNPARLARGLLRVVRSLGVMVFEHSPMTSIDSGGVTNVVRTQRGSVSADAVVLAINAWCSEFPEVRKHLVMTASDNAVVRPPSGWAESQRTNVSDGGRLLDYWRSLADGNFLFGKAGLGLGWGARGASSLFKPIPRPGRLLDQMVRTVPAMAGSHVVSTWRAPVEYSVSSLPFFGELRSHPGVYFGTGYSGDGVGPSVLGGQILASLALRSNDHLASSFLTRLPSGRGLPPEPIRFLGGQLVKTALIRQDRAHDLGRRVDPLTALLTRVDPTSFVG